MLQIARRWSMSRVRILYKWRFLAFGLNRLLSVILVYIVRDFAYLRWRRCLKSGVVLAFARFKVVNVRRALLVNICIKLCERVARCCARITKNFSHYFMLVLVVDGSFKGVFSI